MSKKIKFSAESLNRTVSGDQFSLITRLFNSREVDLTHTLHPAIGVTDKGEPILDTKTSVPVGTILAFDMVPNEKKPGEQRRNYKFLPEINRVDAGTLLDYLFTLPNKGSQNSTIQSTPIQTKGGFGGAC